MDGAAARETLEEAGVRGIIEASLLISPVLRNSQSASVLQMEHISLHTSKLSFHQEDELRLQYLHLA